jgi:hypothetical protein
MGAMTNLLVKDDATSPAEITLVPVSDTPAPNWRGNVSGVSMAGQVRLTIMASEILKNGDYRRVVKLEVPVMETLGASGTSAGYVAPQKVAYVETFVVTQYSSSRSTVADRANSLKLLIGVLQGATSTTATGTLSNTSAGDAWKNSTAPFPKFFTNGEVPN